MNPDRILFVFARSVVQRRARVQAGEIPSETLYGLPELEQAGWLVDVADDHFKGPIGRRIATNVAKLRHYDINVPDWHLLRRMRGYGAVVMKDDLSVFASAVARMNATPLVYLDAMFQLPRNPLRRLAVKLASVLASKLVSYSTTQNALWSRELSIPARKFSAVPFGLDLRRYPALPDHDDLAVGYVLAVGRDPGRDYVSLVQALAGTGIQLKLVTLPYLLRGVQTVEPWIEVRQNVSYTELHQLYAGALAVVVPLAESYSYPAGIRGMLEAMAIRRPLVVTRTPCLEEYARNEAEVLFVPPRDPDALREALLRLKGDRSLVSALVAGARQRVESEFTVQHMAAALQAILREQMAERTR